MLKGKLQKVDNVVRYQLAFKSGSRMGFTFSYDYKDDLAMLEAKLKEVERLLDELRSRFTPDMPPMLYQAGWQSALHEIIDFVRANPSRQIMLPNYSQPAYFSAVQRYNLSNAVSALLFAQEVEYNPFKIQDEIGRTIESIEFRAQQALRNGEEVGPDYHSHEKYRVLTEILKLIDSPIQELEALPQATYSNWFNSIIRVGLWQKWVTAQGYVRAYELLTEVNDDSFTTSSNEVLYKLGEAVGSLQENFRPWVLPYLHYNTVLAVKTDWITTGPYGLDEAFTELDKKFRQVRRYESEYWSGRQYAFQSIGEYEGDLTRLNLDLRQRKRKLVKADARPECWANLKRGEPYRVYVEGYISAFQEAISLVSHLSNPEVIENDVSAEPIFFEEVATELQGYPKVEEWFTPTIQLALWRELIVAQAYLDAYKVLTEAKPDWSTLSETLTFPKFVILGSLRFDPAKGELPQLYYRIKHGVIRDWLGSLIAQNDQIYQDHIDDRFKPIRLFNSQYYKGRQKALSLAFDSRGDLVKLQQLLEHYKQPDDVFSVIKPPTPGQAQLDGFIGGLQTAITIITQLDRLDLSFHGGEDVVDREEECADAYAEPEIY